ncbi:11095_t:CDS:2, partial [Funneliformis geosporum]
LITIHSKDAIHRDLHSGNILYAQCCDEWYISDLRFSVPADKPLKCIYGNLPYIALEVIAGKEYTKASDIYNDGDGQNYGQNNNDCQDNDDNHDDNDGQDNDNGQNDDNNSLNDNYNVLSDDEEAAKVETNQNSRPNNLTKTISSRMLSYDSIFNKQTLNNTLLNQTLLRTYDPPSNLLVKRVIPSRTHDSRSDSYIPNDYTLNRSVNRVAPSKTHDSSFGPNDYILSNRSVTPSIKLSKENKKSTFYYMPSNGIRPSILRANSPFGYIPSNRTVLSRLILLGPKDNTLNISNNTTLT